jgi:hypothetical protein
MDRRSTVVSTCSQPNAPTPAAVAIYRQQLPTKKAQPLQAADPVQNCRVHKVLRARQVSTHPATTNPHQEGGCICCSKQPRVITCCRHTCRSSNRAPHASTTYLLEKQPPGAKTAGQAASDQQEAVSRAYMSSDPGAQMTLAPHVPSETATNLHKSAAGGECIGMREQSCSLHIKCTAAKI